MQNNKQQRDFISRAGTGLTVLAWLLFFAMLLFIFDDLLLQRSNPNQNVTTTVKGQQKEVLLQRNAYGHYVTSGTINNYEVVFLLDTGATDIAIPESIAEEIGLTKGYAIVIKTANGNTKAYRTRLNSVAIGDIALYDLNATILPNISGDEILLGMNFLKHFEIIQKGRTLIIRQ